MIDYVSIYKIIQIPQRSFRQNMWDRRRTDDGTTYYWYKCNGVTIRYYFASQRLLISGKLITILHNTQVQNFDDIYGNLKDDFLDELNEQINNLFTKPLVDIREFTTSRIDYCINVETPYVDEYITFLKRAFQSVDTGTKIDHTKKYDLEGSVYIKNATEYEENARKNYTLNVYNKRNRLEYQEEHGMSINEADFSLAEDLLRVEVQASYQFIQSICKHFSIERNFGSLFDYKVAIHAIETVFKRVFRLDSNCDFYTYKAAKKMVPKGAAERTLYSVATNHSVKGNKYEYGRRRVAQSEIYPFCLLPKGSPAEMLRNPVKLLKDKIQYFL